MRELQHGVERAVIMSDNAELQPGDFFLAAPEARAETQKDRLEFDNYNLEEVEKQVIQKTLSKHQGNVSQAAKELGLTRTSLYRRMEKYGV